ncbi:D-alanine--D-alanine ligase [Candidatus Oleimmundimicrobium sp.]|uniref:D-alanine--D-alanine ligase family protein n=1 Tax=Candidatus Oleimmundimicrobium sp. TaxID=3060597 RepID=UPI0027210BAF|nr:D-alanine--D-alanine ligase [Candidatus Oleimmundimicrobium sp.]MDO8886856.1 D-alanine--D-alanine ligase [Candidatus Oleimmundimicrobium sp.]
MKEKIAILMGGRSLEREVSLKSGHRVSKALREKGYPIVQLDINENLVNNLKEEKPDAVYIALHGKYGEDGTVQELLEIMNLPYTGPGVYASSIGFDKALSKEIFQLADIPTAPFFALSSGAFKEMGASGVLGKVIKKLGLPLIVKPAKQGSALGIKYVEKAEDITEALLGALSYDQKVIIEKYIKGTEVAVSILEENGKPKALPIVEIVPKKEFFDFESMYTMGETDYFVPARLSEEQTKEIQNLALKVHEALRCRDVSRVDMIIDKKTNQPYVLELNTGPGMTETSLLPMAAEAAGIDFANLVEKLVQVALARKIEG